MKHAFFCFLFFVTGSTAFCQENADSSLHRIMSGKWYLYSMTARNHTLKFDSDNFKKNWVSFTTKEIFTAMEDGETYGGKWSYDSSARTIVTNDRDGITKMKILNCTTDILTVQVKEKGGKTTIMEMRQKY